jgi:dihydrofolate reductase
MTRRARGEHEYRALIGTPAEETLDDVREISPAMYDALIEGAFGVTLASAELERASRELATVAILAAAGGDEPFGDVLNQTKKCVVSTLLTSAEWQNSEILSGDVAAKVAGLKAEDGGDLRTSGSATTVRWLLREGLLDELHLFVHPVVVGEGMARLFPADAPQTPLELLGSEPFDTGVVYLTYAPAQ